MIDERAPFVDPHKEFHAKVEAAYAALTQMAGQLLLLRALAPGEPLTLITATEFTRHLPTFGNRAKDIVDQIAAAQNERMESVHG